MTRAQGPAGGVCATHRLTHHHRRPVGDERPARTRWYSPAAGQLTTIAAAQPNVSTTFTTPGDNGASANDWVLVVDR